MIKCACGDEKCKNFAYINNQNQLWIRAKEQELMIYLDANSLVQLIKEAKFALLNSTKVPEE